MAWELEVINWTQRRRLSKFSSFCNFLMQLRIPPILIFKVFSWLNCALRDDEAVYWVIIGHYEAVEVGN